MQGQSLIAFVAVHIVRCTQLTPCQEAFGSEVSNDLVIKLPPNIVGASSSKDMVKRMQSAEFHFQVYRQKARSCFKFTAKSALVSCIDHAHSVACINNEGPDLPSSSSSSVMSRLFSKTTHLQKLIFERINLLCLSSFPFGIVCSCLPWGSEILEKSVFSVWQPLNLH